MLQEVLLQHVRKLWHFFISELVQFLDELWLYLLIGLGRGKLVIQPLYSRPLVRHHHRKLHLFHFHPHPLILVFVHLARQEIHSVPLNKPLRKALVKVGSVHGYRYTVYHVVGKHPIVQKVALPLLDNAQLTLSLHGNRQIP